MLAPDQTLVFIEVRFRADNRFGDGLESVDYRKQRKLRLTAECFLSQHTTYVHHACRFDVVSVALNIHQQPQIDWAQDAFQ